jgi:CRP-like cAMP-binding protein
VVFKKLFGGGDKDKAKAEQELDVDDLIVLERYEEAAERLRDRVAKAPNDLHSHLKLAGVYQALKQNDKAVDQFALVADEYADDGFYDKGIALLAKVQKMAPGDPSIPERIDRLERMKRLEHSRSFAIEGLLRKSVQGGAGTLQGTSVIEAQLLWSQLQDTSLVTRFAAEQLKRLLSAMELRKAGAREVLEQQDRAHEVLYLVVQGTVEAVYEHAAGVSLIRSFGPGDFVGEAALFERKVWAAYYRTTEPTTLMELDRAGLEKTLVGNADPRALIDELRAQHHDRDVRQAIEKLGFEV